MALKGFRFVRRLTRVEGVVWCDKLGEVHDDSLDPYEYGEPPAGFEDQRCQADDHHAVYARQLVEVEITGTRSVKAVKRK